MPEGDTIAWHARRLRPVLEGRVPDAILTPQERHQLDRWPERLAGRAVRSIDTHGKHLFLRFEGGLAVHSHLGMVGTWRVFSRGQVGRRAWIAMRVNERWVAEFNGPTLELLTEGRTRFDQRLAGLGPDVLAEQFDFERFLRRLRADDPSRGVGDALLDQRTVAGIGNVWKAEGCWEAGIDPWRPLASISDADAGEIISRLRPRMSLSAEQGPRTIDPRVYRRAGQPCPRCGGRVRARGQGDDNRTTYWCPGCQR